MRTKKLLMIPVGLVAIAGFGVVTMLLWNWLMPAIFGIVTISFWQALGLLILAHLLFGGIGRGLKQGGHKMQGGNGGDRNAIRDKWMKMTPEERKEFIKKRRGGHGRGFLDREDFTTFDSGRFGMNDQPNQENE